MARYRRVLEIDNGGGELIFRTVRINHRSLNPALIIARFVELQDRFAAKYETRNRFVDPKPGQQIPGYYPKQPGEVWDWVNPPP